MNPRGFASDNNSGIHPKIWESILHANVNHAPAYGKDPFTQAMQTKFREHFGEKIEVYPVLSGTGANVLGIGAVTRSFQGIFCSDSAHLNVDETGAPEKFTGCKLIALPSQHGKIRPEQILPYLSYVGDQHRVQPKVISLTQATEVGTLYSLDEIRAFSRLAREHNLYLHVDGARIANAAAALGVSFRELIVDTGVDVLSFGATKNGLLAGEAVVFFERVEAAHFLFIRKQGLQLISKQRFIAAQLSAYLTDDLWLENARHSNRMAKFLAEAVSGLRGVEVTHPVETNAVFAKIPRRIVAPLQAEFPFYIWDEAICEARWMTAFDTQPEDIEKFVALLRHLL